MTTQFKNHADSMLSIELENKMMVFLPTATVFSSDVASWLKCLADAAQTPVSMLGKIFKTTFFPW